MLSLRGSSPYDHNPNHNHSSPPTAAFEQARSGRKRKAETQDNERLSKRLGRLNISTFFTSNPHDASMALSPPFAHPIACPDQSLTSSAAGQNLRKLYATVEDDQPRNPPIQSVSQPTHPAGPAPASDDMQLDDSKHKVYIYNLDDELSSSESEPEEGKIVFLPDIERALRANRIPPVVRANSEGQLAGHNLEDMQLVLYNVPNSLTVAPEHDNVRKAIIEARARARAQGGAKGYDGAPAAPVLTPGAPVMGGQDGAMGEFTGGMQQDSMLGDDDAMDLS